MKNGSNVASMAGAPMANAHHLQEWASRDELYFLQRSPRRVNLRREVVM